MLKSTFCTICLSTNKRTINIYKTGLQYVYENLTNQTKEELYFLCYICCKRLQQWDLMIKQFANIQIETNYSQPPKSLVHLTRQTIENESIPYHVVLAKEEPNYSDDLERYFEHEVIVERETEHTESTGDFEDSVRLTKYKKTRNGRKKQLDDDTLCKICSKTFVNKYSLATHKRTHTGEKPFTCDVCDKKFTLSNSLNIHKRTHTGEKPYSCEKCKQRFNTSGYLRTHMRTHTGDKPYACETCGKWFRQKNCLTTHMRQHTGEKPYECEVCFKRFSDSSHAAKHRRTHRGNRAYTCDVCNKKFLRSYTLTEHKRIHNRVKNK